MSYYNSEIFPHIRQNFLDQDICKQLIDYAEHNENLYEHVTNYEFWNKRIMNHNKMSEPIRAVLENINTDVNQVLQSLDIMKKPMYPDTLQIVRWFKDLELPPHADREHPDGKPNPFPWRDFATVIYLNDNYSGGEIYWPNKNISHSPKTGDLAIFPGTREFLHGVKKVVEGTRYTIGSFFTYDSRYVLREFRERLS